MWEKIKQDAKARYVIGFLIGFALFTPMMLLMWVELPKGNETTFATLSGGFLMAWGAFINHVMKTPDKEKNEPK
jgi:succinate-acetate transporter protein